MIIRPAQPSDLSTLLKFEQEIIKTERPMDPTIKIDDPIHYYDIEAYIEAKDTEVIVAENEKEVVGSGYGQIRDRKTYFQQEKMGYIGFMYVKPAYRGKGISQMIIGVLCDWFKVRDIQEIRLTVYHENPKAIRAYEKADFRQHMVEMRLNLDDQK